MSGISIVVPIHNGSPWILSLLTSISSSSIESKIPIEVFAFDDCSTDGSFDLLNKYKSNNDLDIKIKSWKMEDRAGSSSASYARIIKELEPKYEVIALSDQDDIWLPNRAKEIANAFANEEKLLLYAGSSLLWDPNKEEFLKYRSNPGPRGSKYVKNAQIDERKIFFDVACSTHNIVIHSDLLRILKDHPLESEDISLGIEADNWIPLIAATHGRTFVDLTPTLLWRQHKLNSSGDFLSRFTLGRTINKVFTYSRLNKSGILKKYIANFDFIARHKDTCMKCLVQSRKFSYLKFNDKVVSDSLKVKVQFALDSQWQHWSKIMNIYLRVFIILTTRIG